VRARRGDRFFAVGDGHGEVMEVWRVGDEARRPATRRRCR
jgi:hypothetical protein